MNYTVQNTRLRKQGITEPRFFVSVLHNKGMASGDCQSQFSEPFRAKKIFNEDLAYEICIPEMSGETNYHPSLKT